MLSKRTVANEIAVSPVAIFDKDLSKTELFRIQLFELCSICGARFGIDFHGECSDEARAIEEAEELPRQLMEILAKDHRQNREHKHFIELDFREPAPPGVIASRAQAAQTRFVHRTLTSEGGRTERGDLA